MLHFCVFASFVQFYVYSSIPDNNINIPLDRLFWMFSQFWSWSDQLCPVDWDFSECLNMILCPCSVQMYFIWIYVWSCSVKIESMMKFVWEFVMRWLNLITSQNFVTAHTIFESFWTPTAHWKISTVTVLLWVSIWKLVCYWDIDF